MTDWRPIETAPKDGSVFVIVMAGEPESYEVGWYEPYYGYEYVALYGGLYRKEQRLLGEWRGFDNFHRATHWLPLPEPPEAA